MVLENTAQYSTKQYSTVQNNIVHTITLLYKSVQYSTTRQYSALWAPTSSSCGGLVAFGLLDLQPSSKLNTLSLHTQCLDIISGHNVWTQCLYTMSGPNGWTQCGNVAMYSTVQYSTVQYGTVQYSTVQYSTV